MLQPGFPGQSPLPLLEWLLHWLSGDSTCKHPHVHDVGGAAGVALQELLAHEMQDLPAPTNLEQPAAQPVHVYLDHAIPLHPGEQGLLGLLVGARPVYPVNTPVRVAAVLHNPRYRKNGGSEVGEKNAQSADVRQRGSVYRTGYLAVGGLFYLS